MAKLVHGKRIGKAAKLRIGCSATIFDESGEKVLLTRRSDNFLWCLPGGAIDPGESVAEAVVRELREETGLEGKVLRLIGVYSNPDTIIEYNDGNRFQLIALNFELRVTGGELRLSNETMEYGFFSVHELSALELMQNHHQRIVDAFGNQSEVFIR